MEQRMPEPLPGRHSDCWMKASANGTLILKRELDKIEISGPFEAAQRGPGGTSQSGCDTTRPKWGWTMAPLLSAARSPGGVAAPPNGHYNMNTYFFKGGFAVRGGCDVKTEPEGQGTMCLGPLVFIRAAGITSDKTMGNPGSRARNFSFFCITNSVSHFLDFICDSHIYDSSLRIIRFCVDIHPSIFAHLLCLPHNLPIPFGIDGKGGSTIFLYYGESRNITGTIGDIDHIFKINSPIYHRDFEVYLNIFDFPNTLVSEAFCVGAICKVVDINIGQLTIERNFLQDCFRAVGQLSQNLIWKTVLICRFVGSASCCASTIPRSMLCLSRWMRRSGSCGRLSWPVWTTGTPCSRLLAAGSWSSNYSKRGFLWAGSWYAPDVGDGHMGHLSETQSVKTQLSRGDCSAFAV